MSTGGTTSSQSSAIPPPSISNVTPSSGIVTTTLVITGQNFGTSQGTVKIHGKEVTPSYWSNKSIEVAVPESLYPGSVSIDVTVGGVQSNSARFDVMLPRTVYISEGLQPDNMVSAFSLKSFDILQELPGSPYPTGDAAGYTSALDCTALAFSRATRRLFALSDKSIRVFDIDPIEGILTAVGDPVSTGARGGAGIVVNAAGTLVYAVNTYDLSASIYPSPSISAFTVSPTGTLTPVSGSPFPQPAYMLSSPALLRQDQILVTNDRQDKGPPFNRLLSCTVDATTGALTPVAGTPFGMGIESWSAHSDPSGEYYYLADVTGGVTGYMFLNSGAPQVLNGMPVAAETSSSYLNAIAFSSDSSFMYVGQLDGNQLSGFWLDGSGIATRLVGSPFNIQDVSALSALAVTRDGFQLVIADGKSDYLMVHSLSSLGIPTRVRAGATFVNIGEPQGLVLAE